MNIPRKPQPSKKYLSLSGKEATIVAYKVATKDGVFDNMLFSEFLGHWQRKHEKKKPSQPTLL